MYETRRIFSTPVLIERSLSRAGCLILCRWIRSFRRTVGQVESRKETSGHHLVDHVQ